VSKGYEILRGIQLQKQAFQVMPTLRRIFRPRSLEAITAKTEGVLGGFGRSVSSYGPKLSGIRKNIESTREALIQLKRSAGATPTAEANRQMEGLGRTLDKLRSEHDSIATKLRNEHSVARKQVEDLVTASGEKGHRKLLTPHDDALYKALGEAPPGWFNRNPKVKWGIGLGGGLVGAALMGKNMMAPPAVDTTMPPPNAGGW
jgi:hypothetical protein